MAWHISEDLNTETYEQIHNELRREKIRELSGKQ